MICTKFTPRSVRSYSMLKEILHRNTNIHKPTLAHVSSSTFSPPAAFT